MLYFDSEFGTILFNGRLCELRILQGDKSQVISACIVEAGLLIDERWLDPWLAILCFS